MNEIICEGCPILGQLKYTTEMNFKDIEYVY